MFAVLETREARAVGVLLGGSGRARMLTTQTRPMAALLRPCQPAHMCADREPENHATGDRSC